MSPPAIRPMPHQTGALGEGTATLQIGTSTTVNPAGGGVPTTAGANLAFMTYGNGSGGLNQGVGPSATETTNRNITVGGTGVVYNSVVLGTMTDDYSAMNGTIALNQAAGTPTTFFARNGGRTDFGGVISGIGSVGHRRQFRLCRRRCHGGRASCWATTAPSSSTAPTRIPGATTVSTGKLYINGVNVISPRRLSRTPAPSPSTPARPSAAREPSMAW